MKASILSYIIINAVHTLLPLLVDAKAHFIYSRSRKSLGINSGGRGKDTDSRTPRKPPFHYTATEITAAHGSDEQGLGKSTLLCNDWKKQSLPNLTVILPAFNEESRIRTTIEKYRTYLQASPYWVGYGKCRCDILVVDDGSTDDTCQVVNDFAVEDSSLSTPYDDDVTIRSVSLVENEGKGAAIARGITEVGYRYHRQQVRDNIYRGWIILVADADGSGDMKSLDDMMKTLLSSILVQMPPKDDGNSTCENDYSDPCPWNYPALVVGNRGYKGASMSRLITRWGFRTTVKLFCGDLNVNDTQCGFKLMTLTAGSYLYSQLNLKRWSHDVEVLFRAKEMGITVVETNVGWSDKEGSKLASTLGVTIQISVIMLLEVLLMRLSYLFGRWKIPNL